MKFFRIFCLFFLMLLPCAKSYALLITHAIPVNNQVAGSHSFTFDLVSHGYNPDTDNINWVIFSYDIEEIIEDPFEDTPDMEEREFVIINDHFLYRRGVFADMDTGSFSERLHWTRGEGCLFSGYNGYEEVCYFQPDNDGFFYSYWDVATENLWMNSISLTIDVTRNYVDEPSPLMLLTMVLSLLIIRQRNTVLSQ
ncbi:MAG: hypothetical protein B0W54_09185 [Cellvibrio sp. 79]|nr:MAG: hypothetical protein B0W54_09185 [Cellvibrio sp. 79]